MIAIANYGVGNTRAFLNIYRQLRIDARLASSPDAFADADRVILPGVGSFEWAMSLLQSSGMLDVLTELALSRKVPFLGVCVGMQMFANWSEEGDCAGLGWIPGRVQRLGVGRDLRVPHMGWNDCRTARESSIFSGLQNPRFYFLHSYAYVPSDATMTLATTDYGGTFASAVQNDNILGVQFHPEKSHAWGIALLKRFAEM